MLLQNLLLENPPSFKFFQKHLLLKNLKELGFSLNSGSEFFRSFTQINFLFPENLTLKKFKKDFASAKSFLQNLLFRKKNPPSFKFSVFSKASSFEKNLHLLLKNLKKIFPQFRFWILQVFYTNKFSVSRKFNLKRIQKKIFWKSSFCKIFYWKILLLSNFFKSIFFWKNLKKHLLLKISLNSGSEFFRSFTQINFLFQKI